MAPLDGHPDVLASQRRWRESRHRLNRSRFRLSRAAERLYEGEPSVRGLMTADMWIPKEPVPLEDVAIQWRAITPDPLIDGCEVESGSVRPLSSASERYRFYAEAMGDLARPNLFEDRPCYRLVEVAGENDKPLLTFGRATFFDIVNVCEAAAHEFAQAAEPCSPALPDLGSLPFRRLIGNPCDLTRRAVVPAISVLTIRRSERDGSTVVLHRRDGAKVAHAGGLYQVMPVGVFQPASSAPWNEANDFDLWRSIAREYCEEFLGQDELKGEAAPIDYERWPFFNALDKARSSGHLRVFWLGLGIDPLSLVADLLVVAVFDDEAFDELFDGMVSTNAEGEVVGATGGGNGTTGIPFTEEAVVRFAHNEPMQAAGAAVLHLAWLHRDTLVIRRDM